MKQRPYCSDLLLLLKTTELPHGKLTKSNLQACHEYTRKNYKTFNELRIKYGKQRMQTVDTEKRKSIIDSFVDDVTSREGLTLVEENEMRDGWKPVGDRETRKILCGKLVDFHRLKSNQDNDETITETPSLDYLDTIIGYGKPEVEDAQRLPDENFVHKIGKGATTNFNYKNDRTQSNNDPIVKNILPVLDSVLHKEVRPYLVAPGLDKTDDEQIAATRTVLGSNVFNELVRFIEQYRKHLKHELIKAILVRKPDDFSTQVNDARAGNNHTTVHILYTTARPLIIERAVTELTVTVDILVKQWQSLEGMETAPEEFWRALHTCVENTTAQNDFCKATIDLLLIDKVSKDERGQVEAGFMQMIPRTFDMPNFLTTNVTTWDQSLGYLLLIVTQPTEVPQNEEFGAPRVLTPVTNPRDTPQPHIMIELWYQIGHTWITQYDNYIAKIVGHYLKRNQEKRGSWTDWTSIIDVPGTLGTLFLSRLQEVEYNSKCEYLVPYPKRRGSFKHGLPNNTRQKKRTKSTQKTDGFLERPTLFHGIGISK